MNKEDRLSTLPQDLLIQVLGRVCAPEARSVNRVLLRELDSCNKRLTINGEVWRNLNAERLLGQDARIRNVIDLLLGKDAMSRDVTDLLRRNWQLTELRIKDNCSAEMTTMVSTLAAEAEQLPPNITSLAIESSRERRGVRALPPQLPSLLRKLPLLQSLKISYCVSASGSAAVLAPALGTLTAALQGLELSFMCVGDIVALAPAIGQLTNLEKLSLRANDLCTAGAVALVPVLSNLSALTQLNLDYNNIRQAGAEALAGALPVLTALEQLSLNNNGLKTGGAAVLAPVLGGLTTLSKLFLSSNNMRAGGMEALYPALRQLNALDTLDLSHNNIRAKGASFLQLALEKTSALVSLNLSNNMLRADGIVYMVPVLARLKVLDLSGNIMSAGDAFATAGVFRRLRRLEELKLCSCACLARADSTKTVASALRSLKNLRRLTMSDNNINAKSAKVLVSSVKAMTRLEHLDLRNNALGAKGGKTAVVALREMPCLERLDLGGNGIDAEGKAHLAKVLKKLLKLKVTFDL